MNKQRIVGIDLGTTNSAVAVIRDGAPEIIPVDGVPLLPSVVGFSPDDSLLIGQSALNQLVLYPEHTAASVKRCVGEDLRISLGAVEYTPVELSAMILKRLKLAAEEHLGEAVDRAVITVPAYFSDAQRNATKEAGEVAGFQVERILNEPTAAALCYAARGLGDGTFLVYDLGGGTFDVSIVRVRGDVTEVLASHGDTALGGDDFDELLRSRLIKELGVEPGACNQDLRAAARLRRAAEEAKIRLSVESYVRVGLESVLEKDGTWLNLDAEIARVDYEDQIEPLLDRTKDAVQMALRDSGLIARNLDGVLLVGGAARTPAVASLLADLLGIPPRMDVNPETAVALGAALQAGRISGDVNAKILVDVTPFSFGTSCVGELAGELSPYLYRPVLRRNTPIPARQTETFYTMHPGQKTIDVKIFQGEEPDARLNTLVGRFVVDGLDEKADECSAIVFDLRLDLDGILNVEITEQHTGLKKSVVIEDAFRKLSPAEVQEARERLLASFGEDESFLVEEGAAGKDSSATQGERSPCPAGADREQQRLWTTATSLGERAERMLPELDATDAEEVAEVAKGLYDAFCGEDFERIKRASDELADILFYLE